MKKITREELSRAVAALFSTGSLTADTDLSLYIRDSIDLGELVAVLKEEYGVTPSDYQLFKTHSRLEDVLKIFNHEL